MSGSPTTAPRRPPKPAQSRTIAAPVSAKSTSCATESAHDEWMTPNESDWIIAAWTSPPKW